MKAPAKTEIKIKTVGALIDEMSSIRERRRAIAAEDSELEKTYKALDEELIAAMDAQGTSKSTGKKASASISEIVVANKLDWMAFMAWMARTKNFQLVQQRVSDPAYRELRTQGKKIPGLEDFTKRSINLRNL
jgi:hypothetical protein